jgi:hypothetical protein
MVKDLDSQHNWLLLLETPPGDFDGVADGL